MTIAADAEAGGETLNPLNRRWWLSWRGLVALMLWAFFVVDADAASGPSLWVNQAIVLVIASIMAWALATLLRRAAGYFGGRDE